MIVGKVITAGGKGLKPQIIVTSTSGSTIDILQDSSIVQTYTLGASETSHTFVVKTGTYTVRKTISGTVTSTTVSVDTIAQYSITI